MSLSTIEQLANSTVRIECTLDNGAESTGTGFFYQMQSRFDPEDVMIAIVTNKHVVKNAVRGKFLLTKKQSQEFEGSDKFLEVLVPDFEKYWVMHPDEDVDLCLYLTGSIFSEAVKRNIMLSPLHIPESFIPLVEEVELFVGMEDVVMIGYPNGLWDRINNLPIFRKGVVATDYRNDWNGKREFLIDAACYPGSSGSPVFLYQPRGFEDKRGFHSGESRVRLLGILCAGPQHLVEGEIGIVEIPLQQKRLVSKSRIPNNLGIVIKSSELRAFPEAIERFRMDPKNKEL